MKKRIFFAMLISAFAAGSFLVSCDDDDDDSGCTCTIYEDGDAIESETITPEEMKEEEYTSCSEIEEDLNDWETDPAITYKCR